MLKVIHDGLAPLALAFRLGDRGTTAPTPSTTSSPSSPSRVTPWLADRTTAHSGTVQTRALVELVGGRPTLITARVAGAVGVHSSGLRRRLGCRRWRRRQEGRRQDGRRRQPDSWRRRHGSRQWRKNWCGGGHSPIHAGDPWRRSKRQPLLDHPH